MIPMMVRIDYTNHRGERRQRLIEPQRIFFGQSEWHPDWQWVLVAFDVEKHAFRNFAMKDIHAWEPCPGV